ncbi:hypothetical protein ET989_10890 [Propioniciclava sinopodophylli]|uniref:Uncharacterized protein n=1 Tax=Propioniciclava sinopodophylli TaxID=1837344 RepID=A0A4Q9KCB6_9ACTN|nr:hypothetical protein [Propioniciclava sinopodophylli]TBT83812.1 hypothetical protein ET989_10890 [Propioniciclava sinopodophylli]
MNHPISQAGYAMLTLVRQDSRDLEVAERKADRLEPDHYLQWVAEFADNHTLLRQAPPAEVAALMRSTNAHPEWLDDTDLLLKLQAGIKSQLSSLDTDTVLGDNSYVVEAVRHAQQPEVLVLRNALLQALDQAVNDAQVYSIDLVEALHERLAKRGFASHPYITAETIPPTVASATPRPAPGGTQVEAGRGVAR